MSKTTQGLVRMLCVGMFADICCLFRTKALVLTREKLILINNYNSTVRHEWVIMKGRDGSVYVVISWYFCCSVLRINRGKKNKNKTRIWFKRVIVACSPSRKNTVLQAGGLAAQPSALVTGRTAAGLGGAGRREGSDQQAAERRWWEEEEKTIGEISRESERLEMNNSTTATRLLKRTHTHTIT